MEVQDLDLSKKLPFIRSNNKKIIVLGIFVTLLIGIVIFSNVYGKMESKKGSFVNNNVIPTSIYPSVGVINPSTNPKVDAASEAPIVVLSSYFTLLLQNNISEARKLISEYSSQDSFQTFESEMINNKDSLKTSYISLKYSQQENFAYITVETTNSGVKSYYRFILMKLNSDWKIFTVEKV